MNFSWGRGLFGRHIFAGTVGKAPKPGNGGTSETTLAFYPGQYTVYAYNKNGIRTASFGSGAEENALASLSFSITSTGCGDCTLTFRKLPDNTELDYMQRIDIHLFGDKQPWYSGYILQRPVSGTTEETFTFKGHGYYNRLEDICIFQTYENMDPGAIVRDIAQKAEKAGALVYSAVKVVDAGYTITKIVFDGTSVKDALKTLSEFAIDYVYGVDEYRQLYFKPRNTRINEEARLTVGRHVGSYTPTWDASKVVNWARIKGGNVDDSGEQWLCTVEDKESQTTYGLRQAVWSLPEAYSVADATRWGESKLATVKAPTKSAKVSSVNLEYPLQDGTFNVRHISTDGEAEIRTLDGKTYTYPISKISYTISAATGISADLQLGDPVFLLDRYLLEQERKLKVQEAAQQSAIRQLSVSKGGKS